MTNVVYAYTRAQAIDDGVLIDVAQAAKEHGLLFPVAMTRAAWEDTVKWDGPSHQDERGRLADVLNMLAFNARLTSGPEMTFPVLRVPNNGKVSHKAETVRLKSICGPGDDLEPVITILLPEED